ncbi:MAG: Gfo/Idh/MocA family oxidoreductase [Caldilineaceae bacterium]
MPPIRIAFIGAGIFARDAHLPSLLNLPNDFAITAVYSRSQASATAFAGAVAAAQATPTAPAVSTYTDLPTLLRAPDIDAIDVVLPIPVMAPFVAQVLDSGKHLISEKPLAADVATCRQLLTHHRSPEQIWMVAENWRYETAYVQAAQLVKDGVLGKVHTCHIALYLPMVEGSKYFGTTWRRSAEFFGGSLIDGGVHHAALLRMIVGEIAEVSAYTSHTSPHFAVDDTMSATLRFANGALGTYLVTYGWGAPWGGSCMWWAKKAHYVCNGGGSN